MGLRSCRSIATSLRQAWPGTAVTPALSFNNEVVEGPGDNPRMISVIEFDSREIAKQWLNSPEYAPAVALRESGVRNRVIILDAEPPEYAREAGAV